MKLELFLGTVVALVLPGIGIEGQTLSELARQHDPKNGPLIITVSPAMPVKSVPELVDEADLVVHGVVTNIRTEVSRDDRTILSLVTFQPYAFLLDRPGAGGAQAAGSLEVEQVGGTVQIEGREVTVHVNVLPPLEVGRELVLFLRRADTRGRYEVLYSGHGVFNVEDGRISAATASARSVNKDVEGASLPDLLQQIEARVARP